MTTILGVVAKEEERAVVLASDMTGTRTFWQEQGDIAIKNREQGAVRKLYHNEDLGIALGIAGRYDPGTTELLNAILEGKVDFHKAIKGGELKELRDLNLSRTEGTIMSNEGITGMLATVRSKDGEISLYNCWPLGKIEEIPFIYSIGSGRDYALKYVGNKLSNNDIQDLTRSPGLISLPNAIGLAEGAINAASTDIYTGGTDLIVFGRNGIKHYGPMIDEAFKETGKNILNQIIQENSPSD